MKLKKILQICLSVALTTQLLLVGTVDAMSFNRDLIISDFEVKTDDEMYEIGVPQFSFKDAQKNEFEAGQIAEVIVPVQNIDCVVIFALFDQNCTLKTAKCSDDIVEGKIKVELTMPPNVVPTDNLQVFVWDDILADKSYCENFSYPQKQLTENEWTLGDGWEMTSKDKYDKLSALKYQNGGNGEATASLPVWDYSNYKVSFYYKGSVKFKISQNINNDEKILVNEIITPMVSEWTKYETTMRTLEATDVIITYNGNGVDSFVDELKFEIDIKNLFETENVAEAKRGRSGFETGNLLTKKGGTGEVTDEDAYSGSKSWKISNGRSEMYGYSDIVTANLVSSEEYVFSFRAKRISGSEQGVYDLYCTGGLLKFTGPLANADGNVLNLASLVTDDKWVKISLPCVCGTVPSGGVVMFNIYAGNNTYLIDDLCIEKID